MPTFMDSLASNPSSGTYGAIQPKSDQDILGLYDQMRQREKADFQDKATFMADLSLKQDRLRKLYDPTSVRTATAGQMNNQLPDTQQAPQGEMPIRQAQDPNQINAYQKGELGIRQQGVDLEKQKLAQQGKMGEEAIGIKQQQEKLNQQKSDQINAQKTAEHDRKEAESSQKIQIMQGELERKTKAGEDTLQLHKDMLKAVEERHNLEMEKFKRDADLKDQKFNELKKQHEDLIKNQSRSTQTKTDSSGNKITTTTEKGSASERVTVKGKDGKTYEIPKDKVDEWNKEHSLEEEQ